jgi:signal transduction histidine kinase
VKRVLSCRSTPARLGTTLLLFFGLTIAGFILATLMAVYRAAGIGEAAESITSNAMPSADQIAGMRTALRHMEVALDDYTDRIALTGSTGLPSLDGAGDRRLIEQAWRRYLTYPSYPGERDLQPMIAALMASLDRSMEQLASRLNRGDGDGAEAVLNGRIKPLIDRLDEELRTVQRMNATTAADLARRILAIRHAARVRMVTLYSLCALFAIVAAFAAIRIVRRYAALMETRVSELESFAGRVAHDIRSPLASVALTLDLAQRCPDIEAKLHATLERGGRTVQRVGQIIDGLLVFALAGAPCADETPANAKAILEDLIDGLRPSAHERVIELRSERVDPCTIACSPGVLTSILSNLIGNAVKYMGDAQTRIVATTVRDLGSRVRIEVRDTGPGIPAGLGDKLFDPFVRAAHAAIPGIGLGLATVRRLVDAHRGSVGFESRERSGSTFWVELPKAAGPPYFAPSVAAQTEPRTQGG